MNKSLTKSKKRQKSRPHINPDASINNSIRRARLKRLGLDVIDLHINEIHAQWWKDLISLYLKADEPFEIRCWKEEEGMIEKALEYGKINPKDESAYEVSITGTLSEKMITDLLAEPKPDEDDQWTPFFTINIGDHFTSAHYGDEIYIFDLTEEKVKNIEQIIAPIKDYISYGFYDMEKDLIS